MTAAENLRKLKFPEALGPLLLLAIFAVVALGTALVSHLACPADNLAPTAPPKPPRGPDGIEMMRYKPVRSDDTRDELNDLLQVLRGQTSGIQSLLLKLDGVSNELGSNVGTLRDSVASQQKEREEAATALASAVRITSPVRDDEQLKGEMARLKDLSGATTRKMEELQRSQFKILDLQSRMDRLASPAKWDAATAMKSDGDDTIRYSDSAAKWDVAPPSLPAEQQPLLYNLHARFPELTLTDIERVVSEAGGSESAALAQLLEQYHF